MRKSKIKKIDLSEAKITPKGKIFLQWLEMTDGDNKEKSFDEIFEEFDQYYKSLFNSEV